MDYGQAKKLALACLKSGSDGVVLSGTTGESPTLTHQEELKLYAEIKAVIGKRGSVIAGTGSNSTAEAIEATQGAEEAGVDACLLVTPYYNKPSQEGQYQHFKAIADNTRLPIILYSIPGRCGIEIAVPTVKRLAADCKNIIGIKEAGGNADRVSQLDSLTLPFMAVGAQGVISVASNVAPREVATMVRAFAAGDVRKALQIHQKLYPLFKDLFIETNPVPVKAALAILGLIDEEYRLPLVQMSAANRATLKAAMKAAGIL